jgi:hypothetical protein
LKLWIIFILQYILIAALDGDHALIHYYYFISLTPTCACIAILIWRNIENKLIKFILLILFLGRFFDICHYDIRNIKFLFKQELLSYKQCENLKIRRSDFPWNQNYIFTSKPEAYPTLGICFGEREGSKKNQYGFAIDNNFPKECSKIDSEGRYSLVKCKF